MDSLRELSGMTVASPPFPRLIIRLHVDSYSWRNSLCLSSKTAPVSLSYSFKVFVGATV
jgi:hypothetical protein